MVVIEYLKLQIKNYFAPAVKHNSLTHLLLLHYIVFKNVNSKFHAVVIKHTITLISE